MPSENQENREPDKPYQDGSGQADRSPNEDARVEAILGKVFPAQSFAEEPISGSEDWDNERGMADTVDVASTVDELVVYLDGYLDDAQRRRVEQRLVEDEQARTDLANLQSAWDALDCLPRPSSSDDFVESTMKLVIDRELVSQSPRRTWVRHVPLVVAASVMMFCSLGLGYFVSQRWATAEERQFLESYRLIENWEKYQTVGDFEFLLRLEKEGLFSREVEHAP